MLFSFLKHKEYGQYGIAFLFFVLTLCSVLLFSQFSFAEEPISKQQTSKNSSPEKKSFSFLSNQTGQATGKTGLGKKDPDTTMDALTVSLGLLLILFFIFSLAWIMRKVGYTNISGQGQLKILATLNLGQKEKISLIQVGNQQLVVGITATQINTLHVLNEPLEIETQTAAKNNQFADKLNEVLKTPHS